RVRSEQNADICELEAELSYRPLDGAHILLVGAVDENVSLGRGDQKGTERLRTYVVDVAYHLMRRKRSRLVLLRAHVARQDGPGRIRLPSHRDGRQIRRYRLLRETWLHGGSHKDRSQNSYARTEQCLHIVPPVSRAFYPSASRHRELR